LAEFEVTIKGTLTHADGTAEAVTIQGQALAEGGTSPINSGDTVKIKGTLVTPSGGNETADLDGTIRKDEPDKGPKAK
jgi:hypothetical protein